MPRHTWSVEDMALMRQQYPGTPTAELAVRLGVSVRQVYAKAKVMGLSKSDAFLNSPASGRIVNGQALSAATRFTPGMTPWNKGTHYVAGGRSAETRFKKGRPAHESRNYVPIGSIRVCADGILERKTTDDPSIVPARRWVAVHRLVWEAEFGPIPKGHLVRFRPGMKTTTLELITTDRLECISRAEHARRNHVRNVSPELAKLVQLKGAITRQVNRIKKQNEGTTA